MPRMPGSSAVLRMISRAAWYVAGSFCSSSARIRCLFGTIPAQRVASPSWSHAAGSKPGLRRINAVAIGEAAGNIVNKNTLFQDSGNKFRLRQVPALIRFRQGASYKTVTRHQRYESSALRFQHAAHFRQGFFPVAGFDQMVEGPMLNTASNELSCQRGGRRHPPQRFLQYWPWHQPQPTWCGQWPAIRGINLPAPPGGRAWPATSRSGPAAADIQDARLRLEVFGKHLPRYGIFTKPSSGFFRRSHSRSP